MKKKDIIKAVHRTSKVTGIPVKSLAVSAGAASVLYGFREETADVDISTSIFDYDQFKQSDLSDGYKEVEVEYGKVGKTVLTELPLKVDLHRGLPADLTTKTIDGISVYSLNSLHEQKMGLNRKKDQREIQLIRHAMTGEKLPLRERVGLIILNKNLEVLVGTNKTPDGDYIVMPGGGVEKGQTHEEAVKQEALEEVGLKVYDIEYSGVTHIIGKEALSEERAKVFSGALNSIYWCKAGKQDLSLFNKEGDGLEFKFVDKKEAIRLIRTNTAAWVPFVEELLNEL